MNTQTTIIKTLTAAAIETTIIVGLATLAAPVAGQVAMVVCGFHLYRRLANVTWGGRFVPKS